MAAAAVAVFVLVLIFMIEGLIRGVVGWSDCDIPAVYNFGDSNSATGVRSSNGRVIIDYLVEQLHLPYLNQYPNSTGGDFSQGANFAIGGASIRPPGFSTINLGVQISLFQHYKTSTPNKPDLSKALYTLDIGQNDLGYALQHVSEDEVRASIPDILDKFSEDIKAVNEDIIELGLGDDMWEDRIAWRTKIHILYNEGARIFWMHNTGPIGCLPYNVIYYQSKDGNLDENGCVKPQNDIAQDYNKQLKDKLTWLKTQLNGSVFTYIDMYSAKYALISNAKNEGFVDPMKFCCGSYYGYHVDCGKTVTVNGTVYGAPCSNPSEYISWDGIHYTEAANQWLAKRILFGSYSDPSLWIGQACQKTLAIKMRNKRLCMLLTS